MVLTAVVIILHHSKEVPGSADMEAWNPATKLATLLGAPASQFPIGPSWDLKTVSLFKTLQSLFAFSHPVPCTCHSLLNPNCPCVNFGTQDPKVGSPATI